MNNDFEKNINGENEFSENQSGNTNGSEILSTSDQEIEINEHFDENTEQATGASTEPAETSLQPDAKSLSIEDIFPPLEAGADEYAEAPDAVSEEADITAKESSASYTEEAGATYNPTSGTYSYSKHNPEDSTENINGCVWDKTSPQKKTDSAKGFRFFVAVMLSVFTVSAACIAGFMIYDYIEDRNDVIYDNPTASGNTGANGISYDTTHRNEYENLVSEFADSTDGLTKSQVAAKCTPSAVGIVVEIESSAGGYMDFGFFGNYYSAPQIVQGAGSGFIYNSDGYIITNHHVVDGAKKITVYLSDKTELEAELIGSDSLSDIAVIKVNPEGVKLVPIEIGNSDTLVVGDEVIAIGCPAGIEYMGTVTDGIISAINRDVELSGDSTSVKKTMTLLQTNATINKGNSGGPLLNAKGQVIGINTLKLGANYEGIGFSIPINGALPIIRQLIEHGKVIERTESFVSSEGIIGIQASPITESEAEYYDIPVGVLVVQIDKDSSAAKAGLRRGDIITAYEGTAVKSVEELNRLKASDKAGDEVTITVYRDSDENGENKTFDITFKLDMAK